jgi:hypothetical protein
MKTDSDRRKILVEGELWESGYDDECLHLHWKCLQQMRGDYST